MDSRAGGIERKLADRDAHAVCAEVAQPEDALAIRHHDELCRVRPVAKELGNSAAVLRGDENASGALEDVPEALAREPNRRRVNQRLDLFDMVAHDPKEERLVAVVQG